MIARTSSAHVDHDGTRAHSARRPAGWLAHCMVLVLYLLGLPRAGGQEAPQAQAAPAVPAAAQPAAAAQAERLEPILPRENPNVVFVEGEAAVSTNFNSQPTLNYSASGKRTLQLSSASDLQGEAGYYADYVLYLPSGGEYELWYGGTPAGPLDELYPSFFSPFRFRIDGGEPVAVYREDMVVNENYAPSYYWNRVRTVSLDEGVHRLRFEIREKRRYDNHYWCS